MLRRAEPLLWIAGVAGVLWLIIPFGYPTNDTVYGLVWGNELAHGMSPDYGAPDHPTPHPLADLWGVVLTPLGIAGAVDATTVVAYLALGAIGYLVYRLGALWFDRPIGVAAALLVLTRPLFLSNGLRAYADVPYTALVLAALVIETRRPRAGWPVLGLLALAGLLRPEAWLFSASYLAYLALERDPEKGRLGLRRRAQMDVRQLAGLAVLAASAPIAWVAFDLITANDPFYSFHATRGRVEDLERQTGPVDLVRYGPGRLGEGLGIPGLVAAAAGMLLGLALMRRRSLIGLTAAVIAGAAFAVLASSGLAIIARYTMLASAVLCVFCALALLGWRLLPRDHPWRRRWQLIAAALAMFFVVQAPQQYDDLDTVRAELQKRREIESDLRELAESGAFAPGCRPISVPNDRAIPWLAAWLDVRPSEMVLSTAHASHGYFLDTSPDEFTEQHFGATTVPPDFRRVASNESWLLYARCP